MKPVVQEDPTGSGIASVAALTGQTCADVKRTAAGLGIAVEIPRAGAARSRCAASPPASPSRRENEEAFAGWARLPARALLAIKWHRERNGPAWHWVVFVRDAAAPACSTRSAPCAPIVAPTSAA